MALIDYRIRFAQHDKGTLLQQRQHETFKALSGGGSSASATIGAHSFVNSISSVGGVRADLLSTAARTPRTRMPTSLTDTRPKSADEHVSKEDARFGRKRIIRAAARVLRAELSKRFGNVYEAYSFLDIDGDWNLSINEFIIGLRRLRIDTSPYTKELSESGVGLMRTLDKLNNSIVDVKTFITMLAWHPRHPNWAAALEQSRENRLQVRERVDKMLKEVAQLEAPVPLKALRSARRSKDLVKSSWAKQSDANDGASDESPSPSKDSEVRQHLAACAIQKRVRGMQVRKSLREGERGQAASVSVAKRLLHSDQPSLGGRKLDLNEQELLADIRASRASKAKAAPHGSGDTGPAIRGRRIDDNLTLPMNIFSLGKTQWLLSLFDYLCVRTDDDGRRTSKIGEGSVCRDISIPDTVVYRQHSISAWYFSDSTGKINMKQHTKEFTTANILASFLGPDKLHQGSKLASENAALAEADQEVATARHMKSDEAVAYFVELAGGPGSWRPDNPPGNRISYFTASDLKQFLQRHQKPRFGILQRLVRPNNTTLHHESIRASWSNHLCDVELCRNKNKMTDKSKDLQKRMATFEAPLLDQHVSPCTKYRADQVEKATRRIVSHINSLLPTGCTCWSGRFNFKINADLKLAFLWSGDLQIRSTLEMSPGFVPRAYNHTEERPAECYTSEQDRCQRITAVQRSPESEDLWAKLTKHDRHALRHLRQSVGSYKVEYVGGEVGWIKPGSSDPTALQSPTTHGPVSPVLQAPSSAPSQHGGGPRLPSKLPKRKQRNLAKFFAEDVEDSDFTSKLVQRSKSFESVQDVGAAVGEEGSNAAFSRMPSEDGGDGGGRRSYKAGSLEDKLYRTRQWKPSAAGVVGRTKFERVGTPRLDGKTLRQPGGGDLFKCPMPSALCLHRDKPIPKHKRTGISYRQILAVLSPDAQPIIEHVLSKGQYKRVGPDTYAPKDKGDEQQASQSRENLATPEKNLLPQPSAESGSRTAPGISVASVASAHKLAHHKKQQILKEEDVEVVEFAWKGKPCHLILSTLLLVQQGKKCAARPAGLRIFILHDRCGLIMRNDR